MYTCIFLTFGSGDVRLHVHLQVYMHVAQVFSCIRHVHVKCIHFYMYMYSALYQKNCERGKYKGFG